MRWGIRKPAEYSLRSSFHRLDAALSHSSCGQPSEWSDEECSAMPKQIQEPGPGRSTAAAAFDELRKEIAQRNEQAHQKARKLRTESEREQILARRQRDL